MYGKQTNTWEEAGQAKGLGVDAIAQGVVGMKSGDKKDIEAPFEEDFEVEPLAGKTISYKLEVHEVREKKPPALNEEFFKSIKVENLEELKDRVLTDLETRKKERIRTRSVAKLLKKFLIHLISLCRNKRLKTNRTPFFNLVHKGLFNKEPNRKILNPRKMSFGKKPEFKVKHA